MVRGRILTPQIDSRSLISEEFLMLAVLEQAFSDLASGCPAVRADAEAYFRTLKPRPEHLLRIIGSLFPTRRISRIA